MTDPKLSKITEDINETSYNIFTILKKFNERNPGLWIDGISIEIDYSMGNTKQNIVNASLDVGFPRPCGS
jgi:hypothetical protein